MSLFCGEILSRSRITLPVGGVTCIVGGMPLARLTSMTIQNNTNAPGAKIVPSVTNVLVLAP